MTNPEMSDDQQLTNYVLEYYSHLASQFEKDLLLSLDLHYKAALSDSPMMKHKLAEERYELIARITNPDVLALLPLGRVECRRRIRDRILLDHSEKVYMNRCPSCQRLARTPVAQMCTHCGKSWYDQEPMPNRTSVN